jgi:uncharacterized protein GlcG (DUF336 family)
MFRKLCFVLTLWVAGFLVLTAAPAQAWTPPCSLGGSIVNALLADFASATKITDISLFTPKLMWAAIVDREGRLCAVVKSGDAWPGSRAIAIAKASTANDFSNSKLALSTANLYGATLPGASLFGLNNSNTFNGLYNDPEIPAQGHVPGGIITFGGGVALYVGGAVVGGFGVSGDTACADHDVAYIARSLAIKQGVISAPVTNDNIAYETPVVPGHFTHPTCLGGEKPPLTGVTPFATMRRH